MTVDLRDVDWDEVGDLHLGDGRSAKAVYSGDGTELWPIAELMNVRFEDSDYTADDADFVVADGITVTLPSAEDGATVFVRRLSNDPTVEASNDIHGETSVTITGTDTSQFVSDGSNWYLLTDWNNTDLV